MSTGDIKGNIAQLQRCLQHLKYPAAVDEIGLTLGDPLAALPVLNFVLLKYSRHVAAYILSRGIQLQGKTDEGFVKHAFRLFRDHLGLRVIITPSQFLEQGFAERKVLLLVDVVRAARQIHQTAAKQERIKLENACRQSPAKLCHTQVAPVTASVQLNGGQPVPEHLRRVPAPAATDAAQELFELISPEKSDLTAAAIAVLASPAQRKPSYRRFSVRDSSPAAASGAQAAGSAGSQRGSSPRQWPGSTHHQQQPWGPHDGHDGGIHQDSLLCPRAVLPKPAQQHQRPQQTQQQHAGLQGSHLLDSQDQLVAAGLLPLSRGVVKQQQQRRPLKACLWPQQKQAGEDDIIPAERGDVSGNGIVQTNSNGNEQLQQQEDEELMGTTNFVPAPQHHEALAASPQHESALAVSVVEMQQQLAVSQAVIVDLQQRLTTAEQQLQEHRSAAAGLTESASARITLLEGRLKFLENLFNSRQQGPVPPAAAGGQHSNSRSKTSAVAAAVMATRSSRSYMPATHFTARPSQPPSPAMVLTSSAPGHSPAPSATTTAGGAGSASSKDWRSAASAAAAAVMAGLAASPLKSPFGGVNWGGDGCLRDFTEDDHLSEHTICQPISRKFGSKDKETCTAAVTSSHSQQQQQQQGGASGSAAVEHAAQARMAQVDDTDAVRRSCSRSSAGKRCIPGATNRAGSAGYPKECSKPAADNEAVDNGSRDTVMLIDKLASRAVEAAAMLEAFRAGNMA